MPGEIITVPIVPGKFQLRKIKRDPQNVADSDSLTLVIFFGWLGASDKVLTRYFTLYHDKGFDILFIPGLVKQFLWPPKSVELANNFLHYIRQRTSVYSHFLIHAVSIGAYNFTSCLMLYNDCPSKYAEFRQKLRGIVFDSITFGSTERMLLGVSNVATTRPFLRSMLKKLFSSYIFFTYSYTLKFYERGIEEFSTRQILVPSIFFYSKDDLLCDGERLDRLIEDIKETRAYPLFSKTWTTSVHAAHLKKHTKEYMEELNKFLDLCFQTRSKL